MATEFGPTPLELITQFLQSVYRVNVPPPPHAQLGVLDGLEVFNLLLSAITGARDELGNVIRYESEPVVNANTNARTSELGARAEQIFTSLTNQIAGAAGAPADPNLIAALQRIGDFILFLFKEQTGDRGVGIPGTIDDLNQTIFDVSQKGDDLEKPISEAFTASDELVAAADRAFLGQGGAWQALLSPGLWRAVIAVVKTVGPTLAPALVFEVIEHFPRLAGLLEDAATTMATAFGEALNRLHRPMEAVIQAGAGAVLRELQDEMFNLGQTNPDNVDAAAARLLSIAGGFGMSAHLAAVTAEKIHPTKHLGFPQLAAYLADAASFGKISNNSVGAQVEAALRSPARRRALAQFRPELPDAGSLLNMLYWRQLADFEFRNFYREQGWSEADVDRIAASAFRAASPREMAMVFEDGEIDEPWALTMLQRAGFNDEDAPRLVRGVVSRAQKTVRQAFIGAVTANASSGIYSSEQAAGYLRAFGLSEPLVQSNLEIEAHKRLHTEVGEVVTALIAAHVMGATTDDELLANFAALGLDARTQSHHLSVARIKRGAKVFAATEASTQAEENRARRDETAAALAAFRRFTIDQAGLEQTLVAIGVSATEAAALVDLAAAQREPTVTLGTILSPGAELQKERQVKMQELLTLVERRQLVPAEATAQLVALGFSPALASSEVGLVAARLVKPPDVAKPPTATEVQRAQQRDLTTAAVDLFRSGLSSSSTLRSSLLSAGYTPASADAIVTREVDRLAAEQFRKQQQLALAESGKAQKAVVAEAVAAFRIGTLDASGLEQTLVAAGESPTVAAATVSREQSLETTRTTRQDQSAAKLEAARVLQADQDAAVFAFRHGVLTADELEQELVDVGTEPALAHAMRLREVARFRSTSGVPSAAAAG